jgi:hypothetical protein
MLNAATILSLVLCVATVALWVRSYYVGYAVTHRRGLTQTMIVSAERGHLDLTIIEFEYDPPRKRANLPRWELLDRPVDRTAPDDEHRGAGVWHALGFGSGGRATPLGNTWPPPGVMFARWYWIPSWFLATTLAMLPSARIARRLFRRRRKLIDDLPGMPKRV